MITNKTQSVLNITTSIMTSFVMVLMMTCAAPSWAVDFMGFEIEGGPVTYVVLKDVNVRDKPETNSKRIKGLKKGNIIQSTGTHMGWISIVEEGQPVGFAYKKFLLPLIDGSLDEEISGKTQVSGRFECNYTLSYAGRSEAGNEVYKMADYDLSTLCKVNGRELAFSMFMFMTEGPYKRSKPNTHQITLDVLQFEYMENYDEIFSTTLFYDHVKNQITFEGANLADLFTSPEEKTMDVSSIDDALSKAVEMTFESWKSKTWQELSKELD